MSFSLQNTRRPTASTRRSPSTCTDARKSFETFAGRLGNTLRTDIGDFLAHSEKVARTHYQFADIERAVDSAVAMSGITRCNEAQPGCLPSKELVYSGIQSTGKPAALSPVKEQAGVGAGPPQPKSLPAPKLFRSPPGTQFEDKKKMIIDHLLEKQNADDLRKVKVPTIMEMKRLFNCHDETAAKTMQRAIRYQKELEWGKYIAERACKDFARAGNRRIADIEDPKDVNIPDHLLKMVDGHCSDKTISKAIKETIREAQKNVGVLSDSMIRNYVETQEWPDIYVKDAGSEKGRGVFNGVGIKFKGTVVCDYHGSLKTREEGLKVLQETAAGKGNYILTFKDSGMWMCVDATRKCPCHSANLFYNVSPSRLINHSHKKPNLKAVVQVLDCQTHVLLKATRDKLPDEELFFDYGINGSEDGGRLFWVNQ